jgi:hypothetical protein
MQYDKIVNFASNPKNKLPVYVMSFLNVCFCIITFGTPSTPYVKL